MTDALAPASQEHAPLVKHETDVGAFFFIENEDYEIMCKCFPNRRCDDELKKKYRCPHKEIKHTIAPAYNKGAYQVIPRNEVIDIGR